MKVKISGYVSYVKFTWSDGGDFLFTNFKPSGHEYTVIGEQTVNVEVPDDFNPVAAQISSLHAEMDKTKKLFAERVAQINEQISKLQCLEMNEETCNGI